MACSKHRLTSLAMIRKKKTGEQDLRSDVGIKSKGEDLGVMARRRTTSVIETGGKEEGA